MSNVFKVGAGSAEIVFDEKMFPVEGFKGVHDNPHVRVILVQGETNLALVSAELAVVAKPFVISIKKIVAEVTGFADEEIWVHGTHTISTPHAPGPKPVGPDRREPTEREKEQRGIYTDALNAAAKEAVTAAWANVQEAKVLSAAGTSDINANMRELEAARGFEDKTACGVSSKDLNVVVFKGNEGPVAVLYTYDMVAGGLDNSGMKTTTRLVSTDIQGWACNKLEEKLGCPVVFCLGAACDQRPKEQALYKVMTAEGEQEVDLGVEEGLKIVEKYGEILAADLEAAIAGAECACGEAQVKSSTSVFTCKNRPRGPKGGGQGGPGVPGGHGGPQGGPGGHGGPQGGPKGGPGGLAGPGAGDTTDLDLFVARIGEVGLVATNPEMCAGSELSLKAASPFKTTLFISMTNGPKSYMADENSFANETAEARASFAEKGSAEGLVASAVEALKAL